MQPSLPNKETAEGMPDAASREGEGGGRRRRRRGGEREKGLQRERVGRKGERERKAGDTGDLLLARDRFLDHGYAVYCRLISRNKDRRIPSPLDIPCAINLYERS